MSDDWSPQHQQHLLKTYGELPPWPFVGAQKAAQMLGVDTDRLRRLANNPIPAVRLTNRHGKKRLVFQLSAVEALAEKLLRG